MHSHARASTYHHHCHRHRQRCRDVVQDTGQLCVLGEGADATRRARHFLEDWATGHFVQLSQPQGGLLAWLRCEATALLKQATYLYSLAVEASRCISTQPQAYCARVKSTDVHAAPCPS